jgi:hypothetical protein
MKIIEKLTDAQIAALKADIKKSKKLKEKQLRKKEIIKK